MLIHIYTQTMTKDRLMNGTGSVCVCVFGGSGRWDFLCNFFYINWPLLWVPGILLVMNYF